MNVTSSIPCPLAQWARTTPNAVALRDTAGSQTWAQWDARVTACAAQLRAQGIEAATRVAICMAPGRDLLDVLVALFRIGAVACPIDPNAPDAYRDGCVNTLECDFILVEPFPGDVHAAGDSDQPAIWSMKPPATLIFTSGSTGAPKAAALSLGNHLACAAAANQNIPLQPPDTWLLSLPMYHVAGFGIFFRCLLAGATRAHRSSLSEGRAGARMMLGCSSGDAGSTSPLARGMESDLF